MFCRELLQYGALSLRQRQSVAKVTELLEQTSWTLITDFVPPLFDFSAIFAMFILLM